MKFQRRFFIMLLLGFFSGLPVALTASTLQAKLTTLGFSLTNIGYISLLAAPYGLRFLWTPFFDRYTPPFLDRRRSWLLIFQIGLVISISLMAVIPANYFYLLLSVGFITALLSTSQDVIISAWQTEIFVDHERGIGATLYVIGWRIGAIFSGGIALLLAQFFNWTTVYFLMAGVMSFSLITTFFADKTNINYISAISSKNYFFAPFKEFFQRYSIKTVLGFILVLLTYKLGDALALSLNTTFLLRIMQFDLATVGLINKTVSMGAAILGGIVAAMGLRRMTLFNGLILFGIIQSIANFGYVVLAFYGKSYFLLVITAFLENFCSGMGTIAFLAFIMTLCNVQFTATQFAFLSGLSFFARTLAGPVTASLVSIVGWGQFFILCALVSLPALMVLFSMRTQSVFVDSFIENQVAR